MTSLSLKAAADASLNIHVPVGQAIAVSSLAAQLRCPIAQPISGRKLIGELTQESQNVPWKFDEGHISGWTQLGLLADGSVSFRGHVHDSGGGGFNYVVTTVLLDVKDQSGRTVVFAHPGSVHGTVDIGSRDDDFQDDSVNCVIAENWDLVKSSRTWSGIHTSNNVLDVIEHVVAGMIIGLAIDAVVILGPAAANWIASATCVWFPGEGILLLCTWN
jgi:hypothetical protein